MGWLAGWGGRQGGMAGRVRQGGEAGQALAGWEGWPGGRRGVYLQSKEYSGANIVT